MRTDIRRLVAIAAETLPLPDPIYEFGALQVGSDPQIGNLRDLFPGRPFTGCDMRAGPGVDKVLDLHRIELPDSTAGTVLLMDTLEHVEYPREAIAEIHRILKPDGIVLMSSVLDFPIHAFPCDYWRFTPEGFRSLLKPFDEAFVGYYGRAEFPHTIVGVGFKGTLRAGERFPEQFGKWRHRNDMILQKLASPGPAVTPGSPECTDG